MSDNFTNITASNLLETIKTRINIEAAEEYGLSRENLNADIITRSYYPRRSAFIYCPYLKPLLEEKGFEKIFFYGAEKSNVLNAEAFLRISNFQRNIATKCSLKAFSYSDEFFVPISWGEKFIALDAYQCLTLGSIDPNSHLLINDSRKDCIKLLGKKICEDSIVAINLETPKMSISFK